MEITASTLLLLVAGALVDVLHTICMAAGGFTLPLVANHGGGRYRVDADGFMVVNTTSFHHRPSLTAPLVYTYGVAVGVGTGHGKGAYFLVLDTASSLTWMRCVHCLPELTQRGSVFDPSHSSSYRPLHPTSSLCRPPNPVHPAGDKCSFHLPKVAHGYVGVDTIILGNPTLPIHGIAFGCAHTTEGFDTKGTLAGTLGMGRLPTSLIMQIKDRVAWRFSYCLIGQGHNQRRHGFIRFGADIPEPPPLDHHRIKIWSRIPRLTLDFEGPTTRRGEPTRAHLELGSRRLFLKIENEPLVCFGVYPTTTRHPTVIGAMQQVDTRFIFDLRANTITIHPESCEADTEPTPSEW